MTKTSTQDPTAPTQTRAEERRAFLFLAVFLAPALAVTLVGTYGFAIWMLQLIVGPPTG
ncbi:periplasmic nitrate reductase, NapE protein [Parasedimentitalea maritima]|uniref:Periplasmic nitrate reductase, NapE protein n=1 Tax=Parasedimentitalea maritima TaxID=2578117 RepID=A0A5R8ZH45_9RHOB|nr:periplasmic nitrate reductase, NapE protein [Zongyanglinia marina]KAE9628661.1 periplasmic nitrate reductase, NapE protein [Zongyanglinia marina]TLP64447.1 periplasmic nitrate reductase, NapE protein [Zongyanglinia marina]